MRLSTLLLPLACRLEGVFGKQNAQSYANNVYILLSASKFYFNYRHSLNVVMLYRYLKQKGVTDD